MSDLARYLAGDNYLNRSASGLKRGLSALADSLTARSSEGIENMGAALSGVRVRPGAILTDAGYVMPDATGQPDFAQVGMEREPDTLRLLELFGSAMGPVKGATVAAKSGAGGKVAADVARSLPMDEASRMARAKEQGYEYFRRSQSAESPDNGIGYAMFVKGDEPAATLDHLRGYGPGQWMASAEGATDVGDLQKYIVQALYKEGFNRRQDAWGRSAADLARDANPTDIVDHAGMWDAPELVDAVYRNVLEPRGITAVRTSDGLISFGHPAVRSVDATFDPAKANSYDLFASRANLGPIVNALLQGYDRR